MYNYDLKIRQYQLSDAEYITNIINRDPFNLQKGITANEFERYLDEPGAKIRVNTFVAIINNQIIGYISLCFVDTPTDIKVDSYSAVDVDWRRKGIGTILFQFIIKHLNQCASHENRMINFVHRVDSRIPGMLELALFHDMVKGHELWMLRNSELDSINVFPLLKFYSFSSPTFKDATAWASIYNDAFNGNKTTESVVHEFSSTEYNPDLYILVSNLEGEPVAYISSKLVGDVGQIPTIAVKQDFQNQGLGKALLTEALSRLKKAGANEVTLSVSTGNNIATKLYEKIGFTTYATRSYYYKKISPTEFIY
jgi:ribosomal protein S18 acetylase RimI-like enzyme